MASIEAAWRLFIVLLLLLPTESISLESLGSNSSARNFSVGCIAKEREALLKFKEGLEDPLGWFSSWVGENCCTWRGVGCNNQTGNVIKLVLKALTFPCDRNTPCLGGELNPSLLDLTHLKYLDLSDCDFQGIPIPDFIGSLKHLSYLNLSHASFGGRVPPQLGNLSVLQYLDLSTIPSPFDSININLWVSDLDWLSRLTSLEYIHLSGTNLSRASTIWLKSINMLPNLLELDLSFCSLHSIPHSLPFMNFTRLSKINLDVNRFTSLVPQWLFNITVLEELKLSDCNLEGPISKLAWGNLCNLETIDLSANFNISGKIRELVYGFSACSNSSLAYLDLSYTKLTGNLPESWGNLKQLGTIRLFRDFLVGPIPNSIGNLSHLQMLDLSFNRMNGTIPESIGQLTKLSTLRLSGNSWEGVINEMHFMNLTKLSWLALWCRNKSFIFNTSDDWIPPFSLARVEISNCPLGPAFPAWLRNQTRLDYITISNATISGEIPDWLWKLSPQISWLDLSHNQLCGVLPRSLYFNNSAWLDLSFNYFEGPVPLWPNVSLLSLRSNLISGPIPSNIGHEMSKLEVLELSGNFLNGSIPLSIYGIKYLFSLDLSNNQLSGQIHSNWSGLESLWILDLSGNNLSGGIPSTFFLELPNLEWLQLSRNHLHGDLSFLQNCTISYIDLGENEFTGSIPQQIGNITWLMELRLRDNMITGSIPEQLCDLDSLHILDLAHNHLSGPIPACLGNMTGFQSEGSYFPNNGEFYSIYDRHMDLVTKGRQYTYGDLARIVNLLDFSSNNLSEEIPEELTNLRALVALNLSWNQLIGNIPNNIGALRQLETLDLSRNHLSGPIPPSMSSMTLLAYLNLSYNDLLGQIPSRNQFWTLNDLTIYEGNPQLCGPPLSTKCSSLENEDTVQKVDKDVEEDNGFDMWFYLSMGLGFIVGFWTVCGSLAIKKSWRHAFFKFLDDMKDRLFVVIAVNVARLQRKLEVERQ